jgi:hypothetical protein
MIKILTGAELVPGKMYTIWGRLNRDTWPAYHQRPTLQSPSTIATVAPLFPLEPFVFLERTPSEFRWNETDPMYDYKILTCDGVVGWLCFHDDDLSALGIGFREYDPKDFEVNL